MTNPSSDLRGQFQLRYSNSCTKTHHKIHEDNGHDEEEDNEEDVDVHLKWVVTVTFFDEAVYVNLSQCHHKCLNQRYPQITEHLLLTEIQCQTLQYYQSFH